MANFLVIPGFLMFLACLGVIGGGLAFRALKGVFRWKVRLGCPSAVGLQEGVCYHHTGHTWARGAGRGLAVVGLDKLGSRIIGRIDNVQLPRVGDMVRQGEVAWTLTRGGRTADLVSPVSGKVVAVNRALERDPLLINRFPLTHGWVFRTRVLHIEEDLENLLTGALAQRFMDLSKTWVRCSVSSPGGLPEYVLTCQDGGEFVEGIGDSLTDEEWGKLATFLFASN